MRDDAPLEGFTDRARKVFQLANQEAHRLNHDHVGTEHLLLGLVKEEGGVASRLLRECGLPLDRARQEVENLAPAGGDHVVQGRLQFAADVEEVIARARAEAAGLYHHYAGTGHLLLALLSAREGKGPQVLAAALALPGPLRDHILDVLRETDLARLEGR
jgi:ATP-dependent Clp protease ATP-binding subunit ClpC